MAQTIYIDRPDDFLRRIAFATFPDYTGRKLKLSVSDAPVNCASYWEGGSRSYFRFLNLSTLAVSDEVPAQSAFDTPVRGLDSVQLPPGFACIEHSIFCGKDTGLTVHIRPENAARLLPAKQEVSRQERIVLTATRSFKNSYAGQSNYRFQEANRETGITAQEWETAKVSLSSKGLLDARGAITATGKNACGTEQLYQLRQN